LENASGEGRGPSDGRRWKERIRMEVEVRRQRPPDQADQQRQTDHLKDRELRPGTQDAVLKVMVSGCLMADHTRQRAQEQRQQHNGQRRTLLTEEAQHKSNITQRR
jgi:hypothetical protein